MWAQDYQVLELSENGPYRDYAPVLYEKGMVFASNRQFGGMVAYMDTAGQPTSRLFHARMKGTDIKRTRVFAETLDTPGSESPGCFSSDQNEFYYTAPFHENGDEKNSRLGIFYTRKSLGIWTEPMAMHVNSKDASYDAAHPTISPDGQWLVFSSNMKDPSSPPDLYICKREDQNWGAPEKMSRAVNSKYREAFPSFGGNGRLYFASDREKGRDDLDLYYSVKNESGRWVMPVRLPEPINSAADDFKMAAYPDGESGYFSSDRNGDDNIFYFKAIQPEFVACEPSQDPPLCFAFEETTIEKIDSLPFRYEWHYGDGTTGEGFYSEHCFPGVGTYDISFNIIDTISGDLYAKVSETQVVIEYLDRPFIQAPDTVVAGEVVPLLARQANSRQFEVETFFWEIDEESEGQGELLEFVFNDTGRYEIKLGALSVPVMGSLQKVCSTKPIQVMDPGTWESPDHPWYVSIDEMLTRIGQDGMITTDTGVDSALYFVEFASSETPIPLNDPFFESVNDEITERFKREDSLYFYSVGKVREITRLMQVYQSLKASGYSDAVVRQESSEEFRDSKTREGFFLHDSVRREINQKLNRFADIQFDLNSDHIDSESHGNLESVLAVLRLEENFRLWIKAHTDDTGTKEFNQSLSERRAHAVRKFFTDRGIDAGRFDLSGYGDSAPIASNETEEGRSRNRRVEFEIVLEEIFRSAPETSQTQQP